MHSDRVGPLLTNFLAAAIILLAVACTGPGQPGTHPTVKWILACRVGAGGFGCYPGDSAFTSRTGMALEALSDLGFLPELAERDSLIAWLQARQGEDGGFLEAPGFYRSRKGLPWGSQSGLEPTYWGLRALNLLGADPVDSEAAAVFIKARYQTEEGGFDAFEYAWGAAPATLYSTFWAVGAFRELGEPVPEKTKLAEWVRNHQNTTGGRGGFTLSRDNFNFSSAAGTYYGVRCLSLLDAEPERPQEVKRFLLSSYGQEADGGFEVGHGDDWNNYDHYSRIQDTYGAVAALELLGRPLTDDDSSRAKNPRSDCRDWISSVQNPDGGFGRLGVTDQTPLPSPSEMMATWQAVRALNILGFPTPRPAKEQEAQAETERHIPKHLHPIVNHHDPTEVLAFRRIALPIYNHFLEVTGTHSEAIFMVSRWVRAAVGPENVSQVRRGAGRSFLMHGWGQCGTMSWVLQAMATSVDHAARGTFAYGDANTEILVREDNWDGDHWICYIPFTNEYLGSEQPSPDGQHNGWSALDLVLNHHRNAEFLNYPSKTELGDHRFWRVWLETIDDSQGNWGPETKIDSSWTYGDQKSLEIYPGRSW
ncbi:prenyltransferase/squalene oxidase repeat-containing protein [candidate division KSB1 bacterium]